MRSLKQIEASRTNGARSKGPITPLGKSNSSRNSLRHGLLARTVVLEEESPERFAELLSALVTEHHPRSATEMMLVETMAVARWRQLRIWGMQKVAMDQGMALQDPNLGPPAVRAVYAFNPSDNSCPPDLLLRYEISLDRQFTRALRSLVALQSKPSAGPPEPYHPEFPSGQTWQDPDTAGDDATAERTQQDVESEAPPPLPSRPHVLPIARPSHSSQNRDPLLSRDGDGAVTAAHHPDPPPAA